uniref:Uncharacterized protein n=1 Tax=Arundo donax TaxID=35708 RepID=A0A0A9EAI0_ARUDO
MVLHRPQTSIVLDMTHKNALGVCDSFEICKKR